MREDYSADGKAWEYLPHDHARSRAYRWGEDGLLGIADEDARLCFALALWNEADPILKERAFGLSGNEGNHGEDVKEVYWYLDNTPTHSFMHARYRYPQAAFPYQDLVDENRRRGRAQPEYELRDTGVFAENRFFDVDAEYAKAVAGRHPDPDLGHQPRPGGGADPPAADALVPEHLGLGPAAVPAAPPGAGPVDGPVGGGGRSVEVIDTRLGNHVLVAGGQPRTLFTENETNAERLWGAPNATPYVKDAFHAAVVEGRGDAVNAGGTGTKAAFWYRLVVEPGATERVLLRLSAERHDDPFAGADALFDTRRAEADAFYAPLGGPTMTPEQRLVQRQAFAGLLWTKQHYHYDVSEWLDGDPAYPPPPAARLTGRNADWRELNNSDILSMPDTWEYPWYAAWDLAFHCLPLAQIDPVFAKHQLATLTEVWYQHPNGQLPAYEWRVRRCQPARPCVGGLARLQDRPSHQRRRRPPLPGADLPEAPAQLHVVGQPQGHRGPQRLPGRLPRPRQHRRLRPQPAAAGGRAPRPGRRNGLDGHVLPVDAGDRPRAGPRGPGLRGHGHQVLRALSLHRRRPQRHRRDGHPLWNEEDQFFYDVLHFETGGVLPLKVRSLVGLIPLLAVETIEPDVLERAARVPAVGCAGSSPTDRSSQRSCRAGKSRAWASGGCWRSCAATA